MADSPPSPFSQTGELWRKAPSPDDLFEISNFGRLRYVNKRGQLRLRKQWVNPRNGYHQVTYKVDGKMRMMFIHRLVALTWVEGEGPHVRHLDGDPRNNAATNLAWGTALDNMADMRRHGRIAHARQTHCKRGHPFDEENTYVWGPGYRRCRICRAAAKIEETARNRAKKMENAR